MSWRAWALILVAVAVLLVGKVYLPYVGWSNSNADARARAEAYLLAVAGGSEDRGWSLLEASGRNEYGSEDTYRRLMVAADWSLRNLRIMGKPRGLGGDARMFAPTCSKFGKTCDPAQQG